MPGASQIPDTPGSDAAPPERPSARGGILTATLTTTLVRVGAAVACLGVGAAVRFGGHDLHTADAIWRWGLGLLGGVVVLRTARGIVRGRFAADIVASFAIIAA